MSGGPARQAQNPGSFTRPGAIPAWQDRRNGNFVLGADKTSQAGNIRQAAMSKLCFAPGNQHRCLLARSSAN
jgi:hypothetical protein